jgi:hypothetical protein
MQTPAIAEYDRFLQPIPCDRCDRVATWTIRYRYAGTRFLEIHTCTRHRRSTETRARRPRPGGDGPVEFERIARTAF